MRPTLEELKKLDREKYTVAPVSYEIFSDFITPIEALKILKGVSAHTYMLESAQADQTWGRYTFLGFEPKLEITCINGEMKAGDVIIALPSSGVHSNGFSLVRKVFDVENADIKTPLEELGGKSVCETLLTPTKIYVKPVLALLDAVDSVVGISHITGGGFYENIPRSIPEGLSAKIDRSAVKVLPIFDLIAKTGNIPERDMFNTFNMGVGMSIILDKKDAEKALEVLRANGEDAYIIGEVVEGDEGVIIC